MADQLENSQNSNKEDNLKENESYEFEDLLKLTGGFGRYQMALFTFLCVVSIPTGAQILVQIFYGASPRFSCVSIPGNEVCDPGKCCPSCQKYEFQGPFTSAVSEWDLICDRGHLKAMTQAVFMAGLFVGAIALSSISDHFGRKLAFFISFGFQATFGVASAAADCLSLFALIRFFAGIGTMGCVLVRFVYCMEMVVTTHRSYVGVILMSILSVGSCVLALLAYLIPGWRHLMLAVSLPAFLPLVAWRWIPRSPRWLIANNYLEEAYDVLMKYATYNHVTVDSKHLKHVIHEVRKNDARKSADEKYGILDTVKTPKLRKRSLILIFNWFVIVMVFFGLNYNVENLVGNMYLNLFILIAIDFPASAVCCFCIQRFGRRIMYFSFTTFCGLVCILAIAVPSDEKYQVIVVILVMVGKFLINFTASTIYVYTSELYPTVIRNYGMGLPAMLSRIGGIAAPYIVLLADLPNLKKTFPLLIFGILGLAAGIMAFWLPETLTSQMPQTVEQVEAWDEDYNIYCCKKPVIQAPRGREQVAMVVEDTTLV